MRTFTLSLLSLTLWMFLFSPSLSILYAATGSYGEVNPSGNGTYGEVNNPQSSGNQNNGSGSRSTSRSGGEEIDNPIGASSVSQLVGKLLDVVVKIGSILAVIFIIYSGYLFVMAGGSPDKIKHARETFLWTIVGTAVILGAKVVQIVIEGTVRDVLSS